MSNLPLDEVVELALQLPLAEQAQLVERLAASMRTVLADVDSQAARMQTFESVARSIGKDLEQLGWSEDEMEAHIEAVRQTIHEQGYDD